MARIEVAIRPEYKDAQGDQICKSINDIGISAETVRIVRAYILEASLTEEDLNHIASELLADPITEVFTIGDNLANRFDYDIVIEVGYLPGVMDAEGQIAEQAIADLGISAQITTSKKYMIIGINSKQARKIAENLLANQLIEWYNINNGYPNHFL